MHTPPVLYARGPYRVIANVQGADDRSYVVVDTAGTWLHEDIALEAACDWVDLRMAELDQPVQALRPRRSRA
ncbi:MULTISPECIES: hypothetical protein [unclassified Lysobacter]